MPYSYYSQKRVKIYHKTLHIITGSDLKKPVLQRVITDPDTRELLAQINEHLELQDEVRAGMTACVLYKVYAAIVDVI